MTSTLRRLNFCSNLSFMYQENVNILQRYESAKSSGFRGVEIGHEIYSDLTKVEDLAAKKEELKLEQILINAFPGYGEFGLAGMPGRERDFEASLKQTFKYTDALDCKRIHFMSGKLLGKENTKEVLETLERNLRHVLPELEKRGIIGMIEPINNDTIPGYLLSSFTEALAIIKAINSPHIRLQVDLFHLQRIQGNLTDWITKNIGEIGHIQIAQVPSRNEPQTSGEIDYNYIFDLLERLNYQEWIGLEYKPLNNTVKGLKEFLDTFKCKL